MAIHCKHCGIEVVLRDAVKTAPFSWPKLQAIWHVCPSCGKPNHIRIENGVFGVIEINGAPGPEWEYVERSRIKDLSFRVDPGFLHISIAGEHFEVASKK
ncbi:MAG: hypothetical protein H2172_11890 [Opitutus sp.]|nr:hypothetical protein [Opitutus sp.]MCS6299903.1 hypothetical protein [Opitutus sp.]